MGLLVEQWRSVESRAVEPGTVNSCSAVNSAGDHRGGDIATVGHITVHWDDRRGGVVDVAGQRAGHLAGGEVVVVAEDVLDAALGADGEGGHHGEQHGKSEDLKRKKRMKVSSIWLLFEVSIENAERLTSLAIVFGVGVFGCFLVAEKDTEKRLFHCSSFLYLFFFLFFLKKHT